MKSFQIRFTIPFFRLTFTPLEPHTPRHPVHDETAHTSLVPTMSAIRRRGNGGAIVEEGERARYTSREKDRVPEERARERESATTSADRFLRSRG